MRNVFLKKAIVFGLLIFFVLFCLMTNTIIVKSVDDEGLVAHWNFDEGTGSKAYDRSDYINDGKIYGPKWVQGISGYALRFDGIDDYVLNTACLPSHLGFVT